MAFRSSRDREAEAEAQQQLEEETATAARRVVASYSEDYHDAVMLASMLGITPDGFVYSQFAEAEGIEMPTTDPKKKSSKKTTKKSTKKTTKKSTKKTTKKTAKKATKKTAK